MLKKTALLILACVFVLGAAGVVLAAEEGMAEATAAEGLPANVKMALALGAGFGVAIAAFGGAIGQSRGIAAALEGIARNPAASGKITTPMIIGLALIESLVIYCFVISIFLMAKL